MSNSRGYFYYVHVTPACGGHKYFKALSKKQIKQYCSSIYLTVETIFDPSHKPADGVHYLDITEHPVIIYQPK